MRLPNVDHTIVEQGKLEGYLLSEVHPVGRFKARFFASLGFTAHNWRELETALRSQRSNLQPLGRSRRLASRSQSGLSSRGRVARPW
ncbi:MAG: hypothetical protein R2708_17200 [Vicinamibacterales bacterium]